MNAVILAGGGRIGPDDPLAAFCKDKPKALLPINGKPMIQYVFDALCESPSVDQILIVGLSNVAELNITKPFVLLDDHDGIIENLIAASEVIKQTFPAEEYFLSVTADVPLISSQIVEHLIQNKPANYFDIMYNVVDNRVMSQRFPNIKRTYIRFKDGKFCGGDMHLFNVNISIRDVALKMVKYRKKPLHLITLVGFGNLIRMLFYPPELDKAAYYIKKSTGINGLVVNSKFAELAMDVDKPEHLELVSRELKDAK